MILGVIPARGGSKGLPGKNLRLLGGVPLIVHTIRAARESRHLSDCLVSTDDQGIAETARAAGAKVPFLRPPELAGDTITVWPAVRHAVEYWEGTEGQAAKAVVLLQPTSPLRTGADLDACIARFWALDADICATAVRAHDSPYFNMVEEAPGSSPFVRPCSPRMLEHGRRQEAPTVYALNGAVFVVRRSVLDTLENQFRVERFAIHEMPASHSVDIDSEDDLALAEWFFFRRGRARQAGAGPSASLPYTNPRRGAAREIRTPILRDPPGGTALKAVAIGGRRVGPQLPCYVIAEAGVNHEGDVALAHKLVEAAAEAGADAVKFQTFRADALAAPDAEKAEYQKAATGAGEGQRAMLRRLELPPEAFRELQEHAARCGIEFLSTPFDAESARFLAGLGVPAFKVSSGDLTNLPLLRQLAETGRPLLLSTGMADLGEVEEALAAVRAGGPAPVVVLHCVSSYPADPAAANLRAMETMARAFGVPVGFSDHTLGFEVAVAAAALGACVLEKHLTVDRGLPGPDHRASLEPAEFRAMVRAIRNVKACLGDGVKVPHPSEADARRAARKSLAVVRPIATGAVLTAADVAPQRPGTGLPPRLLELVLGRRTRRAIPAGTLLAWSDLE